MCTGKGAFLEPRGFACPHLRMVPYSEWQGHSGPGAELEMVPMAA